jgi:predicted nucleic acid-binding protein
LRIYADSSAIIKLIKEEKESLAVRRLFSNDICTSILSVLEINRFVNAFRPKGPFEEYERFTREAYFVDLSTPVIIHLTNLELPNFVKTLDSIHLGTAYLLKLSIDAIWTYDKRMQRGAEMIGLKVLAPAT